QRRAGRIQPPQAHPGAGEAGHGPHHGRPVWGFPSPTSRTGRSVRPRATLWQEAVGFTHASCGGTPRLVQWFNGEVFSWQWCSPMTDLSIVGRRLRTQAFHANMRTIHLGHTIDACGSTRTGPLDQPRDPLTLPRGSRVCYDGYVDVIPRHDHTPE